MKSKFLKQVEELGGFEKLLDYGFEKYMSNRVAEGHYYKASDKEDQNYLLLYRSGECSIVNEKGRSIDIKIEDMPHLNQALKFISAVGMVKRYEPIEIKK